MYHPRQAETLNSIRNWLSNNTISLLALPVILLLCAGGGAALAHQETGVGFGLLFAACGLLIMTSPRLPAAAITRVYQPELTTGMRRIAGLVCLAASVVFAVQAAVIFAGFEEGEIPGPQPWNRFVIGVALWVIGGLLLTRGSYKITVRWVPVLLLVLIIGLAIFLRLYDFNNLPFGVWIDEGIAGMDGRQVLADANFRPFFRPITNITAIHQFLYAGVLKLFGDGDIHSLRLVSVLFGVGGVALAFVVGNQLRGPWFGLVMAFLMAVLHWSINFSRIAMTGVETPFFTLLTFYFITRLARYGHLRDALWVGLCIGVGLWFYAAFRLILIALAVYGVISWRFWRPRPVILTAAAIIFTAVITVFPLGIFTQVDPELFKYRTKQVSILLEENRNGQPLGEALRENTEKHLLMFHVKGDRNGRHNLPGDPMLDPVTGVLFVLGIGLVLRRLRQPEEWFFLLLIGTSLLNGILTLGYEAPQALRVIGVLPAIAYFSAAPVQAVGQRLFQSRGLRPVLAVLCLGLFSAALYFNYTKYFDRQRNDTETWGSYSTTETLIAKQTLARAADHQFFMTPVLFDHPTTMFLTPNITDRHVLPLPDAFPLRIQPTKPVTIFLDVDEWNSFESARKFYPNATFREVRPSDYGAGSRFIDPVMFYLIDLMPSDIASIQGLTDGREGVLFAPYYTTYRFWTSPGARLILDGQVIPQGEPITIAQGNHAVIVDPPGAVLEWSIQNIRDREPIPPEMLYHAPVTANGLYATLYPNADWAGPPALERIDPVLDTYYHYLPLNRPYSVLWKGWLEVPETGIYGLGLRAVTSAELWLDSVSVLKAEDVPGLPITTTLELAAGLHPVEIRFVDATDYSRLHLMWSVNGGEYVAIPNEALLPFVSPQELADARSLYP